VKKTLRSVSVVGATLLLLGGIGCHKHASTANGPGNLEEGMATLRSAIATASPEVQSNFYHGVSYGIRYGDYANASLSLQQIAADPSLNAQQKKAANDVNDLLKQAMASAQNPAPPAK